MGMPVLFTQLPPFDLIFSSTKHSHLPNLAGRFSIQGKQLAGIVDAGSNFCACLNDLRSFSRLVDVHNVPANELPGGVAFHASRNLCFC